MSSRSSSVRRGGRAVADLADRLELRFAAGVGATWPEDEFNTLGLAAFALQFELVAAFRGFCEGRGRTPDTVSDWRDVPAVPVTALKHVELSTGDPELVFLTSGTTLGGERRGRHSVPFARLYRASLLPAFQAHVLPDRDEIRFVSLIASHAEAPDSSLSFMVETAAEAFATEAHWVVDAKGRLDEVGLRAILQSASERGEPVLLLGTARALVHALERWEASPIDPLPPGSRVMETGGFKGAGRHTTRTELHERLVAAAGVQSDHIVNEYGMTELLSQLYEPVLTEGLDVAGVHVAPPWLRVRALDPTTLEELGPGEEGLLAFFDLANAGSVCHVLTEDVGEVVDGRVRLRGRVRGAEPRGCSQAMDELLAAAARAP